MDAPCGSDYGGRGRRRPCRTGAGPHTDEDPALGLFFALVAILQLLGGVYLSRPLRSPAVARGVLGPVIRPEEGRYAVTIEIEALREGEVVIGVMRVEYVSHGMPGSFGFASFTRICVGRVHCG